MPSSTVRYYRGAASEQRAARFVSAPGALLERGGLRDDAE
jgi:hypothetical protein